MGSVSTLEQLRIHRRIHVRLTAIYGAALMLVLIPAAVFIYHLAVEAELNALTARLHMTTVALSRLIDGDRLMAIDSEEDPYRQELNRRFRAILEEEPAMASVYVFARTEDPKRLRFLADADVRAAPGSFDERYDASRFPTMLAGFEGPRVEREPSYDAWGMSLSGYAPIYDGGGGAVAIVGIDTDAARLDRMRTRLAWTAIGISFGIIMLLVLAAIGVGRVVKGPLRSVIRSTEAIASGELSTRVELDREDEFGVLGRHFDQMASGLEEREHIRATFGRYVSEDVARKLLESRGDSAVRGEERVVTVLFSDLRGYSTISEGMDPGAVLALMNQYLEEMSPPIEEHAGCVIEYLGDGIFVVFNAPDVLAGHPDHAVRCALAMHRRLEELNAAWDADGTSKAWRARGIDHLTARIGIHTGKVVAGSLGSEVRMKYAVIGDTVNLAARLEGLNSRLGSDIVISHEVYVNLSRELTGLFEARGQHFVKGRVQPVTVYSLGAGREEPH